MRAVSMAPPASTACEPQSRGSGSWRRAFRELWISFSSFPGEMNAWKEKCEHGSTVRSPFLLVSEGSVLELSSDFSS
jgi:hypothetical protein